MVGYFSDSAAAKLTEIAATLFGASHKEEKPKENLMTDNNISHSEEKIDKRSDGADAPS